MAGNYGYGQVHALCPFYISDNNKDKRIVCEGITDGCRTILSFKSCKRKKQHKSIFCDAAYGHCEIHRMLMEKYRDE